MALDNEELDENAADLRNIQEVVAQTAPVQPGVGPVQQPSLQIQSQKSVTRTQVVIVIAVLILILAGVYYFLTRRPAATGNRPIVPAGPQGQSAKP